MRECAHKYNSIMYKSVLRVAVHLQKARTGLVGVTPNYHLRPRDRNLWIALGCCVRKEGVCVNSPKDGLHTNCFLLFSWIFKSYMKMNKCQIGKKSESCSDARKWVCGTIFFFLIFRRERGKKSGVVTFTRLSLLEGTWFKLIKITL